jgi:hypothetical protein
MRAVRDVCGLVGCGGRKTTRSTIIIIEQLQSRHQVRERGKAKTTKMARNATNFDKHT